MLRSLCVLLLAWIAAADSTVDAADDLSQTAALLDDNRREASWNSLLSSSVKPLGYLDSSSGEATYSFIPAAEPYTVQAEIDLKDPIYVDRKVVRCTLPIGAAMRDPNANDWKAFDQNITCQLRYKRKEVRSIDTTCSFMVNATFLQLSCLNDLSVQVWYHPQTQYPYLSFVLLLPAQLLVHCAKNLLINNFPLQHISVTAVFLSLNLVMFVGLIEVVTGMLAIVDGGLRYLVVTGMFTITSLKFAQTVLVDRLGQPRQQLWYMVFMLIYLNLLSNLATEDWFLLLQSLVLTPQIIHNVINVTKGRFDWNYIGCLLIGHFYIFYYKAVPYNIMNNSPDYVLSGLMLGLIALQLLVLYLQSKRSSRFFLPRWMIPGFHNYHQEVRIGPSHNINVGECSICLLDLTDELPGSVSAVGECVGSESNLDADRIIVIMNTPCGHKFHQECLTNWMDRKMQCPVCRTALPTLEL